MLKEKEEVLRKAMMFLDAILVFCAFLLTFALRRYFSYFYKFDFIPYMRLVKDMSAPISDYILVLVLVIAFWCYMLYLNGMYRSLRTKTILEVAWIIIRAAFFVTIAFATFAFLLKLEFVSRLFFILFLAASSGLIFIEKVAIITITHYVRREGYNYRMLLIVGTGRRAAFFIDIVKSHPEWGLRVMGVIDYEKKHVGREVEGIAVIGTLENLPHILHNHTVDEVIFIVPRDMLSHIENSIYVCETEGIKATVAIDLFDMRIARARQTELGGIPLISFETTFGEEWQLFIKRTFDVIVSGIGIILCSPLFLLTALLIKVTSRGPVFFKQKRVGLNGRRFVLYKFRSMYEGAHLKQSELMGLNEMKGPAFKIKDDPRITRFGRFLRKTSIDELPQLFNVFLGHMSLVGPRPPLPKEVAQYEPWQRRRLSLRPGITCLWQISGRNKVSFEEWMRMDLEYIDNWSLWLDFKILAKTGPAVLFGIGAY